MAHHAKRTADKKPGKAVVFAKRNDGTWLIGEPHSSRRQFVVAVSPRRRIDWNDRVSDMAKGSLELAAKLIKGLDVDTGCCNWHNETLQQKMRVSPSTFARQMRPLISQNLVLQILIGDGAQRYLILETIIRESSAVGKSDTLERKSDIRKSATFPPIGELPNGGKSYAAESCQNEAQDLPKSGGESCQTEKLVEAKSSTSNSLFRNISGDFSSAAGAGGAPQARSPTPPSREPIKVQLASSQRLEGADDAVPDELSIGLDPERFEPAIDTEEFEDDDFPPDIDDEFDAEDDAPTAYAAGDGAGADA